MEEERKYYVLGKDRRLDFPDRTYGSEDPGWIEFPSNVSHFSKRTLSEMIKTRDNLRKRARKPSGRNYEIYELKLISTEDEK